MSNKHGKDASELPTCKMHLDLAHFFPDQPNPC